MSSNMPMTDKDLQAWRQRGTLMNLCSHSIFVIDEGDKSLPVILLIHGFPTASWDWHAIWQPLRKHYRLVCLDMLGFGFSDKPRKHNYTIHQQADLIDDLVDKLALDEFHVLTHDYGVSVAQELLARQIDGTGKGTWLSCCFLNGGLFPETHQALMIQKLLNSPVGGMINALAGFGSFSRSFSRVFGDKTKPSETELKQFWQLIQYNNGKHIFHNLMSYIDDRIEHRERWVHALTDSPIPIALINGNSDPVSGKHLIFRYKALFCRLDYLSELPEIGHYPHIEAPISVAESFLTFLLSAIENDSSVNI